MCFMRNNLSVLFLFLFFLLYSCSESTSSKENVEDTTVEESDQEEYKLVENKELIWHFEDEFTQEEKEFLKSWIQKVFDATQNILGAYPFPTHIYFHNAGKSSEPVPWAHTRRAPTQQVHFHVDLNFTEEEFINDWTAPHEISHLSIPFLGKANSWFAEGYASFMQYQIMKELGIYTAEEIENKYIQKFKKCLSYVDDEDGSFDELLMLQRQYHNYPVMYWGGAFFFYTLDQKLKEHDQSLLSLINDYLACCRNEDRNINDVISSWTDQTGFYTRELYENFTNLSGDKVILEYQLF